MNLRTFSLAVAVLVAAAAFTPAQNSRTRPAAGQRRIVFAVLNDGTILEPIAYADKGKLTQAIDNAAEAPKLSAFHRSFYRPASKYRLIFGGADAGSVTVKSADPRSECGANTAGVSFNSAKARLKGNVMALATNLPGPSKGSGIRRLPTPAERTEIESLVRAELERQKISPAVAKNLKYHNLTAVDSNGDGKVEQVGTFWVDVDAKSRALLFFIAELGSDGKYSLGATDYRVIAETDVMSGEIVDVDKGVYHERLLDLLDVDNDGTAEIFTYVQSFEGAGFNAYRRSDGKWTRIYEGANYHCAF